MSRKNVALLSQGGLKGYITNTDLDASSVIAQYHGLWVVERAFRVSKGKLEARPTFHFTERRIEAHICICFIAYKAYKELERLIAIKQICMSVDKVLDMAKTVVTVMVGMPQNGELYTRTLFLTKVTTRYVSTSRHLPTKNRPKLISSFRRNLLEKLFVARRARRLSTHFNCLIYNRTYAATAVTHAETYTVNITLATEIEAIAIQQLRVFCGVVRC